MNNSASYSASSATLHLRETKRPLSQASVVLGYSDAHGSRYVDGGWNLKQADEYQQLELEELEIERLLVDISPMSFHRTKQTLRYVLDSVRCQKHPHFPCGFHLARLQAYRAPPLHVLD